MDVIVSQQKIHQDMQVISESVTSYEKIRAGAKKLSSTTQCIGFLHHLKEQEKEARWIEEGIEAEIKSRQKRGFLGELLTSIFGVNDEVYTDIDRLEKNQKELITASNHQAKFMLSAISTFNETERRVNDRLERFRAKLNQGIKTINEMQAWYRAVDDNKLNININNAYQLARNVIEELCQRYNHLLNVNLGRGNIYDLVTPSQVHKMISDVNMKLPSNIYVLSSPLIKMKVIHKDAEVQVQGFFPIVEITEFELVKVNSIPLRIQNTSYWVLDVPTDIIAIDYNNQLYFQMTDEDFRRSIGIAEAKYLCSPNSVKSIEANPNCAINEIYHRHDEKKCEIREIQLKTVIWKQLYMENTWLFISIKPFHVAVICSGVRQDVNLNQTGIIQVTQECVIKTPQYILHPKRDDKVIIQGSYNKPVSLPDANVLWQNLKNPKIIKEEPHVAASKELQRLKADEEDIAQEISETRWYQMNHHHRHLATSRLSHRMDHTPVQDADGCLQDQPRQGHSIGSSPRKSKSIMMDDNSALTARQPSPPQLPFSRCTRRSTTTATSKPFDRWTIHFYCKSAIPMRVY